MSLQEQTTRLLLIRHAHHDHRGRFFQHACPGLTETGITQAKALATRLARDLTLSSVVVLASRSRRSFETAEILTDALRVSVAERTCDLCEMHPGAAEGLTQEEMERQYGPTYAFVPGADHFPDWLPQACAALERIAATYRGRTILAVTHSGVIRASFLAFGRMPLLQANRVWCTNTGITEWSSIQEDETGSDGQWRLDRHNDAAHLEGFVTDS